MLNRIYIVVGMLAILVLAGAFIAPRFIQWSDYRDRMEELATSVLGAEVTIRGDIAFSLLPTPRLEFSDVVVGDIESPAATVEAVEAEFALIDFLRDNYNVTALTLNQPRVDLVLDENGLFSSGVDIAGNNAGVTLGQARISNGSIRLTDLRADTVFTSSRIDGDLRLAGFTGPFQFQGFADYETLRYEVRFNSGPSDAEDIARITTSLREVGNAYSVSAEGLLTAGMAPKFDGVLTYRQAPPAVDEAEEIRGDLVLEGNVTASTDRAVMSGFTLMPDENRAATRLTGAASVQFGARNSFDAVVSGGVFALPPRDATEVASEMPLEFVRLLSEIPAPPLPPIPGRLGIDLAEASLRGFALREIRIDATTDGSAWTIEQAVANLPGETEVRINGTVTNEAGRIGFSGDLNVASQRLDALAALWREQGVDNPLFNQPGALEGRLMLAGDAFGLSAGRLTFAGQSHALELRIGFGNEPRLDGVLTLGALTTAQTAALQSLVPDTGNPSFAVSFPYGSLTLAAERLDVLGLTAADLAAEAQWTPQDVHFSRLAASDWGGIRLDATARLAGNLSQPHITGSGDIAVSSANAPALDLLYETGGVPFNWQQGLSPIWPADLQFILTDSETGSGQVLTLGGTLGSGAFDLRAELSEGVTALATGDLRLITSLEGNADTLQQQFGFGDSAVFSGVEPLVASVFAEGNAAEGYEGRATLSQGEQTLGYFGNLRIADDGTLRGEGTLELVLEGGDALAELAGASGASFGPVDAAASLAFEDSDSLTIGNISGVVGETGVRGDLSMRRSGGTPIFSGALEADAIDAGGLAAAVFGTEALLGLDPATGPWPEGPLAVSSRPRQTRGEIAITAGRALANGIDIFGRTSFTYGWDADAISLRNFEADVGGGSLSLTLSVCCSGALTDRTISGRVLLDGVNVDGITPPGIAAGLDGVVGGGLQFEGTGASLRDAMATMTGEGNFSITDFAAAGLSAAVFPSIAAIEDPLNTDAETLETLIGLGLSQGDFTADLAQGAFNIAGGTARLANLIIEGQGGRLAGGLDLALASLQLDGDFVLSPRDYVDPSGLVQADTARIVATIDGSLAAPLIGVDLSEMVAAIQVRANELEVDRLETMRLEDEARQREAAEARNRLIEEQQRRRAEEEAARLAAEEEARRLEEEQAAPEPTPSPSPAPTTVPPSNSFEFIPPPTVNQPFGNSLSQPVPPLN